MTKLASLDDLLVHEMQDIYHAESQIIRALPKMIKAASHPELQSALEEHLEETETHVGRLERAFKLLGAPAKGHKSDGMVGLIDEGKRLLDQSVDPAVLDAALIAMVQKIEHYEIATYGCLCTYAELLGHEEVHDLLGQTLEEEETADEKLTALAESLINVDAERGMQIESEPVGTRRRVQSRRM